MALTRAAPTRTTIAGPEGIKCDGHTKPARKFQAGPTSKNPGRWFYTCPLARDDPQRCKFFKWADELASTPNTPSKGQVLGASPGPRIGLAPATPSRLMRPTGSALHTPSKAHPHSPAPALSSASRTPTHPQTHPQTPSRTEARDEVVVVSDDEIDWESLDADSLERDAEARATPKSAQVQKSQVQARLEALSPLTGKRKLSEGEEERTPKRVSRSSVGLTPGDGGQPVPHDPEDRRHTHRTLALLPRQHPRIRGVAPRNGRRHGRDGGGGGAPGAAGAAGQGRRKHEALDADDDQEPPGAGEGARGRARG